jgi:hypothetical protein
MIRRSRITLGSEQEKYMANNEKGYAKEKSEPGNIKEPKVGPKGSIHPGSKAHHAVESINDPKTGKLKPKVRERVSP